MKQQSIFVTVGSTNFDELIKAIDNQETQNQLKQLGYNKVVCQIGSGNYEPKTEFFRFKSSLTEDYQKADLIICHCGAGTILECLKLKKKIIVVNNDTLMNNHQMELFNALTKQQLVCGIKSTGQIQSELIDKIKESSQLKAYPLPEPNKIDSIIDSMF